MLWYAGIARRFSPSTSKISQSEISIPAVNGNDKNNGITPDEALKSLEAANRIVFGEGDKLLLKCGCVWKGMLCLHGDGDRFNFAQVGVYGNGEAPLID